MTSRRRLAIVIPWFGRELNGGAEVHAWQLAKRLAARDSSVEVLTTCCRSHAEDWSTNHLPAGLSGEAEAEGFEVKRFEVAARDRDRFDAANGRLLAVRQEGLRPGVPPVSAEDEEVFCRELIRSPTLLAHLTEHRDSYDAVILLPYLYGPVIDGVHLVADRSLLQPCLHDEAYAYLPAVARAVFAARRLLFLSEGERQLAIRLFGPGIIEKSILTGAGVEFAASEPDDSVLTHVEGSPFVLCLGRKDPGKKTDFLAKCFLRYKREHPQSSLRLVIAGPGRVELPLECPGLVDLGVVSEAQKRSLLRNCAALFHPSENESYSRVIMEAWLEGRPAAANAKCLATATAVSLGGGWLATTEDQWTLLFDTIDGASTEDLAAAGDKGRRYAAEVANWDAVIGRYEDAIDELKNEPAIDELRSGGGAKMPVHQVLPNVVTGDAISNQALWIRRALQKLGHPSEIFAIEVASCMRNQANSFSNGCIGINDGVIYHHSIGSAVTSAMVGHQGPKCFIYHNITPHQFLEPYFPLHARLCREGREELPKLAAHFPLSAGDSIFNSIELSEAGFRFPGLLPVCVNPGKWQLIPDASLMARLQDGRINVLFVGRLSPNKKQEDLILAFSRLRERCAGARLFLVGSSIAADDLYLECLRQLCTELHVDDAVEFVGHVSEEQLAAYYRTAHLFWCMSEHEGFCVPVIEAMWFDVPVFAFASSAIPETLAGAGCLFSSKQDFSGLAAQARQLACDVDVRRQVIEGQRVRRTEFLEQSVSRRLESLVARMFKVEAHPVKLVPPEIGATTVRRIAVVKLDHIGDVLLASPVFESLHRRFPNAAITAVVAQQSSEILRNHPYVAETVLYDPPWFWRQVPGPKRLAEILASNADSLQRLAEARFDLVVNLRSDLANVLFAASLPHTYLLSYTNKSAYSFLITHPLTQTRAMHICEQHRELLAVVGATNWPLPRFYPSDRDRQTVAEIGRAVPGTVAVFAGAGIPLKCWAPVKFKDLVRRLRLDGVPVSIIGSASDSDQADEIANGTGALNLCGKFSLLQLGVFLEDCAALVTNDSAPMHIGAVVGTTVVYITRPNTVEEFAPIGSRHLICCAKNCANPCGGFDAENRSDLPVFCRCIQSIGVDEVEAKVWDAVGGAMIRRRLRTIDDAQELHVQT
jgi:ADP-heptose:LPS heptosyltransferase/glycosyltransferase involved in cell wall biosynthesis